MATSTPRWCDLLPVLVGALIVAPSYCTFCSAAYYEPDLIPRLPGQAQPAAFKQYGGYVAINATAGRAFYYYFVEAKHSPATSPLTLWLNGGPGCSSVGVGAFTEIGPFAPTSGELLVVNKYSWNKYSNLLFVESPAGVGFSYSNTSSDYTSRPNDATTAEDNLSFLLNWLEKFPEFKGRSLYITGESYAGHYIPQLATNVISYMKAHGTTILNLTAIAIGNPALDSTIDSESLVPYSWTHGLITYQLAEVITKYCNFSADTFSTECNDAWEEAAHQLGNYINPYDIIVDICVSTSLYNQYTKNKVLLKQKSLGMDVCILNEVTTYLNRQDVQDALHAFPLPYNWTICSSVIKYGQASSTMIPILKDLLNNGLPIFTYSGDEDFVVPFIGTEKVTYQLAKIMGLNVTTPYTAWFQGQQVGGWTIGYGDGIKKLMFATVRGAAHVVPTSQPKRALQYFKSFITNTPLPTSPNPKY